MKSQKQKPEQSDKVLQAENILKAVSILNRGGVIAYPTEAVYGLGCDPKNLSAVKKILELKQRKKEKGLILIASSFDQLKPYLQPIEKNLEEKLLASWNNPEHAITWLIPAKKEISPYIKGEFDTIAVRVSHHPIVKEICNQFKGAIISTSANVSNQEAVRKVEEVKQIFKNKIDFIFEGKTNMNAQPSEIRDALTDKKFR